MEAMQESTYVCLDGKVFFADAASISKKNATSAVLYDSKVMAWPFVYVSATVRRHHMYSPYSGRQINSTSADIASLHTHSQHHFCIRAYIHIYYYV